MRPASVVIAFIFSSYAFAAKAPEVFSAIEDESESPTLSAPAPTHESAPARLSRSAKPAKAAKSASASKKPKAAPVTTTQNQAPAPIATFDAVPEAQAQAVAQRLKLIETLIVRYGRAYDYRALTLKDLEKLVAELEHGKSSGLAAVPTPATASAPAAAAAPATRVPADNAEADDSLATSQAAPADIGDAEKGLPEIPPPAYHDDAGNLAPDTAPAPPTAE